ncbi:hypothetical protein BDV93DRAFT_550194 [Ceratobasidium sp. AG-I]|nr:hypothetical protein BDV93DRAFT_550194 [Ceratobasidium sp. AG-I]
MKGFSVAVTFLASVGAVVATSHHREKRLTHTGRMTWFNLPEGNDACGQKIPEGAAAVHVSKDIWNNGKNCGQWMSIAVDDNPTTYGVVTGYCEGCTSEQIDCTPSLFSEFAHTDVGILQAKWKFMKKGWTPPDIEDCEN